MLVNLIGMTTYFRSFVIKYKAISGYIILLDVWLSFPIV